MSARHALALALGLLAGGSFTIAGQACTYCEDVEPLRFQGGEYSLDYRWGEDQLHPDQERVDASLDLKTNTLVISYDSPDGPVVESWTVGGIDVW